MNIPTQEEFEELKEEAKKATNQELEDTYTWVKKLLNMLVKELNERRINPFFDPLEKP